jgi:integrase
MRTGLLPATYRTMRRPGLHADGGCLYFQITADDDGNVRGRSWVFRFQRGARVRDMGLGSVATVTLNEAREIARQQRKLLLEGLDPIEERNARVAKNLAASAAAMSFDQAAEAYQRQHRNAWSPVHARQWTNTVKTYASPIIGRMSVADISTASVMRVIEPIWQERTETASRLRGRIEAVLDWAAVSGYRSGESPNPARWKGHLDQLLPARRKVAAVKHMAALPYSEMPAFMTALRARTDMAALALEFCILTAVRSADVFNAQIADIDRAGCVWVIKSFSKTHKEHRVPLAAAALAALDKARKIATEIGGNVGSSMLAFPSPTTGGTLDKNAMRTVLVRMGRVGAMTTHGARASFRTWAQERMNFPWELSEMALGHTIGDAVARAYARGDALKKRFAIMEGWSDSVYRPSRFRGGQREP